MAGTFWFQKDQKILANKVFKFMQQSLNIIDNK